MVHKIKNYGKQSTRTEGQCSKLFNKIQFVLSSPIILSLCE